MKFYKREKLLKPNCKSESVSKEADLKEGVDEENEELVLVCRM